MNHFAQRLKEAAREEQRRRREHAWRRAEAHGYLEDAKVLRLIANVELFAELADGFDLDGELLRECLARSFAVFACPAPIEERCREAAALTEDAGYGECDPRDLLAVFRHPAYTEFDAAIKQRRDPDYEMTGEDCMQMLCHALQAGAQTAEPGDEFPPPGRTRIVGDNGNRRALA
jgi:hypothetical protein